MDLIYKNKKSADLILSKTKQAKLQGDSDKLDLDQTNLLIKGDNLEVMQALLKKYKLGRKIDLVYIDPPFSTDTIFKYDKGRTSTVSSSNSDLVAYHDKIKGEEYIEFIRERLIFVKELMADHASIYFHIDYKIGHYIKIIIDEIFGVDNFRNDIARIKCKPKNFPRKGYGNVKDLILFYTKTSKFIWNEPLVDFTDEEIERLFSKVDKTGRRYTTTPLHAPGETKNGRTGQMWKGLMPPRGRHWRYDPSVLDELDEKGLIEWSSTGNPRKTIFADEIAKKGKRLQDIWDFKDYQYPSYPTEKNLELLKTIIKTSSNEGDIVFDCFCGSGTTLVAAQELGRKWIGIDNSKTAIEVAKKRIQKTKLSIFYNPRPFLFLIDEVPTSYVYNTKHT